jgi:phosphatidate cytidylyltransferase
MSIKVSTKSELFYRILTTIVALPLLFIIIAMGSLFLLGLSTFIAAFAYWEYSQIVNSTKKNFPLSLGILLTCLLPIISNWGHHSLLIALTIYLGIFFIIFFIFKIIKKNQYFRFIELIGVIYIGIPISFAILINNLNDGTTFLFLIIAIVFTSDSFSYFTGKLIGKHLLAPTISSGKTWEGLMGGLVGTLIAVYIFPKLLSLKLDLYESILIALTIGLMAPIGDLVESKLKRSFNVKNSGILIPGHGGILDRLDSLGFGFIAGYFIILRVL